MISKRTPKMWMDMSPNYEELRSHEIAEMFWFLPLLSQLLDLNQLKKRTTSGVLHNNLARGYAFCIASLLWRVAKSVIQTPELLDMENDRTLMRARQAQIPFHQMPTKSRAGRFVRKITILCRSLMAVNSFDDIEKLGHGDLGNWFEVMSDIFNNCYRMPSGLSRERLNTALKMASVYRLLRDLQDVGKIRIVFNHTFNKSRMWLSQWTHLPMRLGKQRFFEGYRLALSYLWEELFEVSPHSPLMVALKTAQTWNQMDLHFESFLDTIVKPYVEAHGFAFEEFHFQKIKRVRDRDMTLISSIPLDGITRPLSVKEQLDEVFMWYPIFVVDGESSAHGFLIALEGAMSLTKSRINVLKVVHGEGRQHNFSFAILLESTSNLADYSRWWAFPDCGTDYSGTGGMFYREITNRLRQLHQRINLKEVCVDSEQFEDYVRSSIEQRLRHENLALMASLSDSRATLLELVYTILMQKRGFSVFWRYKNSQVLGASDIDVLAIEQNESRTRIEIAECTRRASKDDLTRLLEKRELVARNLDAILQETAKPSTGSIEINASLVTFHPTKLKVDKVNVHSAEWLAQECKRLGLNWTEFRRLMSQQRR